MGLKLIQPPSETAISLPEIKQHLRLADDYTLEDTHIESLILVAQEYCEQRQARAYTQRKYELSFDTFPPMPIYFPMPPLISVESFTLTDYLGATITIDPAMYTIDTANEPGRLALTLNATYPAINALASINGVKLTYTAGGYLPEAARQAIKFMVAHWYLHREPVVTGTISSDIQFTVDDLLRLDKVYSF